MPRVRTIKVQQNTSESNYTIHSAIADKLSRSSKLFTSSGYQGDKNLDGNIVVNGNVLTSKTTFSKSHVYGYTVCFLDGSTPTAPGNKNEELTATLESLLTKSRDVSVNESTSGSVTDNNGNVNFYPNPYYKFNLLYNTTSKNGGTFAHNCTLKLSDLDSKMKNGQEIFIIFRTSHGELNISKDTSFSKATYFGQLATEDSINIESDEHPHTAISILKLNDWYYVRDLGAVAGVGDVPPIVEPEEPEPDTGSVKYTIDSCDIYYKTIRGSAYSSLGSIPNTNSSPLIFFSTELVNSTYVWEYVYKITISPTGQSFSKTLTTSDFTNMVIDSFGKAGGDVVAIGNTSNIDDLIDSTSVSVSIADGSSKTIYVAVSKTDTLGNIIDAIAAGCTLVTKQKTGAKLVGNICGTSVEKTVNYYYKAAAGDPGTEEPEEGNYSVTCDSMTWCSSDVSILGEHTEHEIGTMKQFVQGKPVDSETIYIMDNKLNSDSSIDLLVPLNILPELGKKVSPEFHANRITITELRIHGENVIYQNKKGDLVAAQYQELRVVLNDLYAMTGSENFKESLSLTNAVSNTTLYVYFKNLFDYNRFKQVLTGVGGGDDTSRVECNMNIQWTDEVYGEKSVSVVFYAYVSDTTLDAT